MLKRLIQAADKTPINSDNFLVFHRRLSAFIGGYSFFSALLEVEAV
jgi:hypothetical protein